ncbi:hypothetical protein HYC85_010523 [Camellia sinensis]|uniref:Uncharacterized protein n=1 Tax=Camellia sinensis TaxID=4442 RepID=A0A7J7HIN4_CAMSI|nr:hypothetical protein HYC85_010523 [Camellia sinensis]
MRKPEAMGKPEKVSKSKVRKGLWSPEEDEKLMKYMMRNGQGCWSDIARNAGLQRCGKSCRLRWINYLRPDLKRVFPLWISSLSSFPSVCHPGAGIEIDMDGTTMSMQEQGNIMNMCMDTFSSSWSMHGMPTPNSFNPFPLPLDNAYDARVTAGLFSIPTWLGHVGMGDGCCEDYGIGEERLSVMGELEGDLSIPSLESRGIVENNGGGADYNLDKKISNNNHLNNNNNNSDEAIIKAEDVFGFGNHWQGENLKMGEWDLDGLLENVSSFPYLDFQVE